MQHCAPHQSKALNYMAQLDKLLAQTKQEAPDAAFFLTATHGMNSKQRCWDLAKVCQTNGYPLLSFQTSASASNNTNGTLGTGCAWISLEDPEDESRVREIIDSLAGIEAILSSREAAARFRLPPTVLGDLVILGDSETVFGELDCAGADLPENYRAHGSLHETEVPLIIYNQDGQLPPADVFESNKDLTRFLYC